VEDYSTSLSDERRILFDRYRFEDAALKVVGIGSVGTRCMIGLFFQKTTIPCCASVSPIKTTATD
jgi:hypothetical protein